MALKDKSIRTQILLFIGLLSGIALFIVVGVAIGIFAGIGITTKNLVFNTLEGQAETNLLQSASGVADVINRKLQKFETVVLTVANATKYIFQGIGGIPNPMMSPVSYFWYDSTTAPPNVAFDPSFGYNVSLLASVYLLPDTYPSNISVALSQPQVNFTVNQSAQLDYFFPQLLGDRDVSQLQVGFTDTHVYRRFPGTNIPIARTYDPTVRPWYLAGASASPGTPAYVSIPYLGAATNQWTIAIATAIPSPLGYGIFGVAAAEIRLATIQKLISQQKPFNSNAGYAAMIALDGTIISDPSWNPNITTTTANLKNISTLYSQLQPLNTAAVSTINLQGQDFLVAQFPVRSLYVLLFVVPKSDVLQSSVDISNRIDTNTSEIYGITIGVGFFTLLAVLFISTIITVRITRPLAALSTVAVQIARNAANTNKMENVTFSSTFNQKDEIGDLTRAFTTMITKLTGKKHRTVSSNQLSKYSFTQK